MNDFLQGSWKEIFSVDWENRFSKKTGLTTFTLSGTL